VLGRWHENLYGYQSRRRRPAVMRAVCGRDFLIRCRYVVLRLADGESKQAVIVGTGMICVPGNNLCSRRN